MAIRWLAAWWATRQPERPHGDVEVEAHGGRRRRGRRARRGQLGLAGSGDRPAQLAGQQHDDGDAERQRRGGLGGGDAGAGELHVGEDGQRVRVVGEQHGRAVLADRAQPGHQHPGPDAGSRDAQAHPPEPGQGPVPEGGGEVVERRVDGGERRPGRDDEERRGDEGLGEDHAGHRIGEAAVEELAERGVRADEVDQHDAARHRRYRQRQLDQDADDGGHRPARPWPASTPAECRTAPPARR